MAEYATIGRRSGGPLSHLSRTGDAGKDATHIYRDPKCWVMSMPRIRSSRAGERVGRRRQGGVGGYILGPSTRGAFEKKLEAVGGPAARLLFRSLPRRPFLERDERMHHLYHHPSRRRGASRSPIHRICTLTCCLAFRAGAWRSWSMRGWRECAIWVHRYTSRVGPATRAR